MENFIKKYIKKYGYEPSIYELFNLYTIGELILTDEEENELLKTFNTL